MSTSQRGPAAEIFGNAIADSAIETIHPDSTLAASRAGRPETASDSDAGLATPLPAFRGRQAAGW
jgi:hypothetical protein